MLRSSHMILDVVHPSSSSPAASSTASTTATSIVWLAARTRMWILLAFPFSTLADFNSGDIIIGACPSTSINGNLRTLRRCRPNEFYEVVSCGAERKTLQCPNGRYIAVHSASAGKSEASTAAAADDDCIASAITNETDCSVECVVNEVNELCLGKRRCQVGASDMLFSRPCWLSSRMPPPETGFLWLLFTCVSKNATKGFNRKASESPSDDFSCSEELIKTTLPAPRVLHLEEPIHPLGTTPLRDTTPQPPADRTRDKELQDINSHKKKTQAISLPQEATSSATESTTTELVKGLLTTRLSDRKSIERKNSSFASVNFTENIFWTLNFVSENTEKCILYLMLGFLVGVILILLDLILVSYCQRRRSERYQLTQVGVRMTDSSNSLKWRSADSESSIDDDGTGMGHSTGPRWSHGRHLGTWSPQPPPTTANSPDLTVNVIPLLETRPKGVRRVYERRTEEEDLSLNSGDVIPAAGPDSNLIKSDGQYFRADPKALDPASNRQLRQV